MYVIIGEITEYLSSFYTLTVTSIVNKMNNVERVVCNNIVISIYPINRLMLEDIDITLFPYSLHLFLLLCIQRDNVLGPNFNHLPEALPPPNDKLKPYTVVIPLESVLWYWYDVSSSFI